MKSIKKCLMLMALVCFASAASAAVYQLGPAGDDLIGKVSNTVAQEGDDFNKIANRFDLGYVELIEANPGVNPQKPIPGTVLIIPSRYILPHAPRQGVVINLAEMRLYYFPKNTGEVWTFPVGIGRQGSQTPNGTMTVLEHMEHPTWHSPESVRAERAKEGVYIPKIVPPGPDNPLGDYALRLSRPTYLIHGTNDNSGVGRRSSSGCLRMYPEDIEKLFHAVKNGDSILVMNAPYKLGRHNGNVYVEGHLPLQEVQDKFTNLDKILDGNMVELGGHRTQQAIDMKKALRVASEQQGFPQRVGQLQATPSDKSISEELKRKE
jgi:L,D-transpeptidase ErfK/SrfK